MGVTPRTRNKGNFLVENRMSDNGSALFAEDLECLWFLLAFLELKTKKLLRFP